MKKFLTITTAILVLLLVSFWGYIQYQRHASYQTRIPANTRTLIRVDIVRLGKSLAWEYFSRKKTSGSPGLKGISIPANLFIFNLSDKQSTTLLSTVGISDWQAFRQSLAAWQQPGSRHEERTGVHIVTNASHTFCLAYNNTRAVFAYSPGREQLQQVMIDILQDKNTVTVASSAFRNIKQQEGHVTFQSGEHTGSLHFNKGNIQLLTDLSTKGCSMPARVSHPAEDSSSTLNLWLFTDYRPLLTGKIFKVDTFRIYGDSLLACQLKGVSLRMGTSQVQKDSVITYEYNDDFEKVATVSIVEKTVPGILLEADAGGNNLYRYLSRQHIIRAESGIVNHQVFPLYQAYATPSSRKLQLSTSKSAAAAPPVTTSGDFFGLNIDFVRLQQLPELATIRRWVSSFDKLQARARQTGPDHCTLKAKLVFKNQEANALFQLWDSF
jgi:hypothetical protein